MINVARGGIIDEAALRDAQKTLTGVRPADPDRQTSYAEGGHTHPDLLDAGVDAALSDTVMQGNLQQGAEMLRLGSVYPFHR